MGRKTHKDTYVPEGGGVNNGRVNMPAIRVGREKRGVRLTAVRYIGSVRRVRWPTII